VFLENRAYKIGYKTVKPKTEQLALIECKAEPESLKSWALVELMGRQRIVGWMTVDPPEFPGLIRVDVPDLLKDGTVTRRGFTRYFARTALYGVTPIDEATVRKMLPAIDGTPGEARPYSMREDW
jgi:hypothetical protein